MNPQIATIAYAFLIAVLFYLNRDSRTKTSPALWLPVIWLGIGSSRGLSTWFGWGLNSDQSDQYLEGSPFDRAFLTVVVVVALAVLIKRREKVAAVLRANIPIVLFTLYCAISILWSDYPDVALKRWVKSLGDLSMVLLVLTETNPLVAVRRWMSRTAFLLVPASMLLVKYYPDLGRGYNRFTWQPFYQGVATDKNGLGLLCLICGIGAVWQLIQLRKEPRTRLTKKRFIAQSILLVMVCWLLYMANSMTSFSCFVMASTLMFYTSLRFFSRRPWTVHILVALLLSVSLSALFGGGETGLVQSLGRDPTLTGRTEIWTAVLALPVNPWIGTGFESFWLGWRLDQLWSSHWWHPNEAHNGYLEVFLNLGWIGIVLLALVLVTGYRSVIAAVRRAPDEGRLRLAFFFTALAYNCTESAVRIMHPAWIGLLLAVTVVPGGWARIKNRKAKTTQAEKPKLEAQPAAPAVAAFSRGWV
jgi:exopolysaccharide production protein ExoQ